MGRAARLKWEKRLGISQTFPSEPGLQEKAKGNQRFLDFMGEIQRKIEDETNELEDDWSEINNKFFVENPTKTQLIRKLTPNEAGYFNNDSFPIKPRTAQIRKLEDGSYQREFL